MNLLKYIFPIVFLFPFYSSPCLAQRDAFDLLSPDGNIIGFDEQLEGHTIDGQDISQVLFENAAYHREIFWHYDQNGTWAYRSGDWKIVGEELYNLAEDIAESNNLAGQNPEKYQELRSTYDSLYNNMAKYQ